MLNGCGQNLYRQNIAARTEGELLSAFPEDGTTKPEGHAAMPPRRTSGRPGPSPGRPESGHRTFAGIPGDSGRGLAVGAGQRFATRPNDPTRLVLEGRRWRTAKHP